MWRVCHDSFEAVPMYLLAVYIALTIWTFEFISFQNINMKYRQSCTHTASLRDWDPFY